MRTLASLDLVSISPRLTFYDRLSGTLPKYWILSTPWFVSSRMPQRLLSFSPSLVKYQFMEYGI